MKAVNQICGCASLTPASRSLLLFSGLGEWLSLRVPPRLRRRALREGHRRVRQLAVSERRPLSRRSERISVPVSGWLLRKSLPGEPRLPHRHLSPMRASVFPSCVQHFFFSSSLSASVACIFGFVVKFSCPTLLNGCCSTVLLLKRECFVEAAPGYSGIHSSVLKPRLRGRVLCLCLVFFFPPSSSKRCACVVSWHSLWGGCLGFCSVFCSRNCVSYQVHYSLFKTFSPIAGY